LEFLQQHNLVARKRQSTPYAEWASGLQNVCGSFTPHTHDERNVVLGSARRIEACGMEFAHISNDLDHIHRDWSDIRRDATENLFLVLQLEGRCGVEHLEKQDTLEVGDCVLLDSTRPTTFFFGGQFSNHISLHLPRQTMYLNSSVEFDISRKLSADDPMAVMLKALIAKIMSTQGKDQQAPQLRELTLRATRQAFARDVSARMAGHDGCATTRMHNAEILIDRHLTDNCLSAKWLANSLGISLRTLQQDFQDMGLTCTMVIRNKRLGYARERLRQLQGQKSGTTIADIAYSAGFNDISYFNRSFKDLFDCAPSDFLHQSCH
jgi:AraC-like DNA-binding protein